MDSKHINIRNCQKKLLYRSVYQDNFKKKKNKKNWKAKKLAETQYCMKNSLTGWITKKVTALQGHIDPRTHPKGQFNTDWRNQQEKQFHGARKSPTSVARNGGEIWNRTRCDRLSFIEFPFPSLAAKAAAAANRRKRSEQLFSVWA